MGALHAHVAALEEELGTRGSAAAGATTGASEAVARAETAEAKARALEAEAGNLGRQVALLQVRESGSKCDTCFVPRLCGGGKCCAVSRGRGRLGEAAAACLAAKSQAGAATQMPSACWHLANPSTAPLNPNPNQP